MNWRTIVKWLLSAAGVKTGLVFLGITLGGIALNKYYHLQKDLENAEIREHNLRFTLDSTKVVYADGKRVVVQRLGRITDSVNVLRDLLGKAEGKAKVVTVVQVAPKTKVTETVTSAALVDSEFTASVSGPPAAVVATVKLETDTIPGRRRVSWAFDVRPTPFFLTVDIGCRGPLDPDVLVQTPPWIRVDSISPNVTKDVCPRSSVNQGKRHSFLIGAAAGVGACVALCPVIIRTIKNALGIQ